MGRMKEMWMAAQERACEDYSCGDITENEFVAQMRQLGFDEEEIAHTKDNIDFDNNGAPF